jgi:hypothetical protein
MRTRPNSRWHGFFIEEYAACESSIFVNFRHGLLLLAIIGSALQHLLPTTEKHLHRRKEDHNE